MQSPFSAVAWRRHPSAMEPVTGDTRLVSVGCQGRIQPLRRHWLVIGIGEAALHCIASHRIVLPGTAARDGQAGGGKQGVGEEMIEAAGLRLCFSPP